MQDCVERAIPGPQTRALLGHLGEVKQDFFSAMVRWYEAHGDIVRVRLGPKRLFMISHPSLAEEILIKQQDCFVKSYDPAKPRGLALVLGNGLVTSSGALWQRQRRMIQPMFHRSQIARMAPLITHAGDALLEQWAGQSESACVDVAQAMKHVTLEIITQTMFSASVQNDLSRLGPALDTALNFSQHNFFNPLSAPLYIPTRRNRQFKQAMAVLKDLIIDIIDQRRITGERKDDLLDVLLHARDKDSDEAMSAQQIIDEALTVYTAGHETTANALAWTWYLLSEHEAVRRRFHDEIDTVLGGRAPGFDDLENLPFTRAVLEESMRLYPPVVAVIRSVVKDTKIGDYAIPKGALVVVNIRNMQHHPQLWKDPEIFRPERFLPAQRSTIPRLAYMPFGAGPRVCLGNHLALMEGHMLLAQIGQRFDLTLKEGHPVKEKMAISLRPLHGLPMHIRAR